MFIAIRLLLVLLFFGFSLLVLLPNGLNVGFAGELRLLAFGRLLVLSSYFLRIGFGAVVFVGHHYHLHMPYGDQAA